MNESSNEDLEKISNEDLNEISNEDLNRNSNNSDSINNKNVNKNQTHSNQESVYNVDFDISFVQDEINEIHSELKTVTFSNIFDDTFTNFQKDYFLKFKNFFPSYYMSNQNIKYY